MKKLIVIMLLALSACGVAQGDMHNSNIRCEVISRDRCLCFSSHNRVNSLFTESCTVMREGGYRIVGEKK